MSRAVQCLVTKKHVCLRTLLESQGQRESVGQKNHGNSVELLSSMVSCFDLEVPKTYCTGHKSMALRLEVIEGKVELLSSAVI